MLYKLSLEKVRKKTITDAMYRVDDDVGKDCLTIVCRGKEFDAFGFCWSKRLERSTHYKYFLKPGSVTNESVSSAVGRFTGYGS